MEFSFPRAVILRRLGGWLGLAALTLHTALTAATYTVTTTADSGPGSLREAIAMAAAGDTIDATGVAGTITLASELVVDKSLTLTGPGQDVLILSGNHATRVLHLSSADSTVSISGLTVADGHQASAPGPEDFFTASGGIFSRAALTLSDCAIRGNSITSDAGWYGGGVTSLGPLTVTHCLISGNSGDALQSGGGIVTLGTGAMTVVDSTIVHNDTIGIYASSSGGVLISRCTLSGNTWMGAYIVRAGWTVDQCTLSGNGGIGLQSAGAGKILNSTIVGHPLGLSTNPSTGVGVIGNTIFDNERDTNQRVFPLVNDKAPISLGHNLTRGNAGGDASTGPGGWLNQPTDRRNTDPLLGPLQNNGGPTPTHALLPGSPAIDAGGGSDELQSIAVSGSAGTFTLTFNGATTAALPFNATAAEVQDALNALSSIGGVGGSVAVVRNLARANEFFVSFSGGTLAAQDQPLMTGSGSGGTSGPGPFTLSNGGPLPTVDQRSFPRPVNQVDIGAVEYDSCLPHATVRNTRDSGYGSLRQALADICQGGTIDFAPTLRGRTITLTSGQLVVPKSYVINGPGADLLTLSGNQASRVFNIPGGTSAWISGLTIADGEASDTGNVGGGIFVAGNLSLSACTIIRNSAGAGGGIYNSGNLTLTRCTVSWNDATQGVAGGVYNQGTLSLANCTVSGNLAVHGGGGIYNIGSLSLNHCTVRGNISQLLGSAILNNGLANSSSLQIGNTILANAATGGNLGRLGEDSPSSLGYNLSDDGAGGFLTAAGDVINTDPLLGPLQDNGGPTFTHALLAGSPALDAGDPASTLTTDQRGSPRPVNGRSDIGAVENAAPVAEADTLTRPNTTRVAKVLKSDLLGNDTDADSDPLTLTAVGNAQPAGATVVLAGNFVVYTAPANNAGNGSFTYTLSDGTHTVTGTVTVTEGGLPAAAAPNAIGVIPSGNDFVVTFLGVPGGSFRVQYSTAGPPSYDWQEFVPPASYTAAPNGVFTHTDVNPPDPVRFYRAVGNP